MPGTWSLSTTVRNPERLKSFLIALSEFEGKKFDKTQQANYFKSLIKYKLYKPNIKETNEKSKLLKMYEEESYLTDEQIKEILSFVNYENKQYKNDKDSIYAFRGRTAVSNLNKMGLAIAKESEEKIIITELGKKLLKDECSLSEVMFRYFLKWQLPNPLERGYHDFNINPFIATLHIIDKVNKIEKECGNKPKGISKEEFALFIVTLTNYKNIDEVAKSIAEYRKKLNTLEDKSVFINNYFKETVMRVFSIDKNNIKEINKKINNLIDYADSAIRYFRQTGFIYYRGNGRYVDLSPTRKVELTELLKHFDGSIIHFNNEEEYIKYLADINKPELPWENREKLIEIHANLKSTIEKLEKQINSLCFEKFYHSYDVNSLIIKEDDDNFKINKKIEELRDIIKVLNIDFNILREKSMKNLDSYINILDNLSKGKKISEKNSALDLEWYTALTLMALDDAEEIKPNLILGDDLLPIFTAPGNSGDIECYYKDFNMLVEVTLLRNREQWFNEGQPVMRHLRDFENKFSKDTFCLFIAPSIHRDTLNTFWISIKYEYEGKKQKIIPLTIQQYINILKFVKELKNKNKYIKSYHIKMLLNKIYESHIKIGSDSFEWLNNIDNIINEWKNNLLNEPTLL